MTVDLKGLYTNIPIKSALERAKIDYSIPDLGGRSIQTPNDNDIHFIHKDNPGVLNKENDTTNNKGKGQEKRLKIQGTVME